MRIVWAAHTLPNSGVVGISRAISRYVYHISENLIKMGHEVVVYVRDDFKPQNAWVKTVYSPKFSWIPYPFFLGNRISKETADVFHGDYVTTGAAIVNKNKRPSVVSIHDVIPFGYENSKMSLVDRIRVWWYMKNFDKIRLADAIVVGTNYAKKETMSLTRIPEEKIHVIHFGIDTYRIFPKKNKKSDKIKIGYLGGLDGRKNVELLLNSYKILSKKYENIELHIGGSGKNLEKFKSMNLPRTFIHGEISYKKINDFLNSLDIFVFPTTSEGFGLPPVEAMACKVPVVACNVSTMPEVVGKSGILTQPNPKSMSSGIERLISSPSLRKSLSKKGYKKSREFTWENCAKQAVKVYESISKR